jgi:glycosyltransferase involved in cell wall biosynthesis
VRLLLVVPAYPYADYRSSGIFSQRSAAALAEVCESVEVLVPRPYVPSALARLSPRWTAYSRIPASQNEGRLVVHRPAYLQIPGAASPLWAERAAYLASRRLVEARHAGAGFDAILSFDLRGGAPVAWRLARHLGLPVAGWATGSDVRVERPGAVARAAARSLRNLDLVFYQSGELRQIAAGLLGTEVGGLDPRRHVVLPRGVAEPPARDFRAARSATRDRLGIGADETAVVTIGRISRAKGIDDLLAAASLLAGSGARVRFVLAGARPGFDESERVSNAIASDPALRSRVQLLPACAPEEVWDYLAACDIFAFPSHAEGMPNSPLEAMAMERPVVAFSIPAVEEIDGGEDVLALCPPFDVAAFAESIRRLAIGKEERARRGAQGRAVVHDRFLVRRSMAAAVERLREETRAVRGDAGGLRSVASAGR